MIAHLSAITLDPLGSVWLTLIGESKIYKSDRRVNRVKTLDGGYVLTDGGFAHCDRDATLMWRSDEDTDYLVRRLMELYGQVYLAIPEGLFLASIREIDAERNTTRAQVYLLEKLTS